MKNSHATIHFPRSSERLSLHTRLCAVLLIVAILFSASPSVLSEGAQETNLSLYFANATIKEGKASGYAEQFFSSIAAISLSDLTDQQMLTQLMGSLNGGFNLRVFVTHEKGAPDTDLTLLYCFKDTTWVMRNTTSMSQSVYLNASWAVLDGINLKMKQKAILQKLVPNYDAFYECDGTNVVTIYIQFMMFIEARNKVMEELEAGITDHIPELPESIEDWPLEVEVSVQLPKEITILEACFTAQPATNAAANFEEVPESQRFEAVIDENNLVKGVLSFWEAGLHKVHLVYKASINDYAHAMSHEISIDTSGVQLQNVEICPLYGAEHQWRNEWAEEHPHAGRLVCDCGETMDDPNGATTLMLDCCQCYGHDWALSYYVFEGKGKAAGTCRRCGLTMDVTDSMPDYIRDYVKLLGETGTEGNAYFEKHDTGKTAYLSDTAAWVYVADQAVGRYSDEKTSLRESFVNTLAEPIVSLIHMNQYTTAKKSDIETLGEVAAPHLPMSAEDETKIDIRSKEQLLWIQLFQDMMLVQDSPTLSKTINFVNDVDLGMDIISTIYGADTDSLKAVAESNFSESVTKMVDILKGALKDLKSNTSTDQAVILEKQNRVKEAAKNLEELKKQGPDYSGINPAGEILVKSIPHIMNGISAILEGTEAGIKAEELRLGYIEMLNEYSRSRKMLDAIKADAQARNNQDLEAAVNNMLSVLDATFRSNTGKYFDATTRVVDAMGNEFSTLTETKKEVAINIFKEKTIQTVVMGLIDNAFKGISPIGIASTAAKIMKGISNYDEVFDDTTELAALSDMHKKANLSLMESTDQVSPYTLALYAKLESEGSGKAAELVSKLDSKSAVNQIMQKIITVYYMGIDPVRAIRNDAAAEMNVKVEDFGIGRDEQETVVLMLQNEQKSFEHYVRQCLRDAEAN